MVHFWMVNFMLCEFHLKDNPYVIRYLFWDWDKIPVSMEPGVGSQQMSKQNKKNDHMLC